MTAKKHTVGKRLSVRLRRVQEGLCICEMCGATEGKMYLMYNDKFLPHKRIIKLRRIVTDKRWNQIKRNLYGCCAFCRNVIINRKLDGVDMIGFIKFLHYMRFTYQTVREYTLGVYRAHTTHISDGSVQRLSDGSIVVVNRDAIAARTRVAINSYNRYLRWRRKVAKRKN